MTRTTPTRIKHLAWRWEYLGEDTAGLRELLAWVSRLAPGRWSEELALSEDSALRLASACLSYLDTPRRTRSGRWRLAGRVYKTRELARASFNVADARPVLRGYCGMVRAALQKPPETE